MTLDLTAGAPQGCCSACAATAEPSVDEALAIACSLGPSDMAERLARIRALAERSLIRAGRRDNVLHLLYDGSALAEVEEIVAAERVCCAFLDFTIERTAQGIAVTVAAPVREGGAAEALFGHFLPAGIGAAQ